MVDRYTLTPNSDELALVLGAEIPPSYVRQFNAAPTKMLPTIRSLQPEKVSFMNWGLMTQWSNNKSMSPKFFNLSLESVLGKSNYRRKLLTNRCVIPMDGFYLWKQVAKKQLVPYYFSYPDKRVFSVAGIWEDGDEDQLSFMMITRPANSQILEFQTDMPAILDAPATRTWLQSREQEELVAILEKDNSEEFMTYSVSPKISDIEGNSPEYTKPAPPSDQHGNYTLFT